MDTDNIRRFAELKDRHKELKDETEELGKELANMERELLEEFADAGTQSIKVDGRTVYMKRQLWARRPAGVAPADQAQAALAAGLDYLVEPKVSTQGLSAYVRDMERADEALPPELDGFVRVDEVFTLGVRKA